MKSRSTLEKTTGIYKSYRCYLPLFVYFLGIVFLHLVTFSFMGDDVVFASVIDFDNFQLGEIIEWLKGRYNTWSSRLIIESVLIFVSKIHWLWLIIDSFMYLMIAYCISLFFNRKKSIKVNWLIVIGLLSIPYEIMLSAGWIAGSTNYLWPAAMGLYALIPVRNILLVKKNSVFLYVTSILALLYATNQEQMVCIMGAVLGILLLRRKKFQNSLLFCWSYAAFL